MVGLVGLLNLIQLAVDVQVGRLFLPQSTLVFGQQAFARRRCLVALAAFYAL